MGEGDPDPRPTFCITVDGDVVGWVDQEYEPVRHTWLVPGEVNIGYGLHPDTRGKGYTTRAVQLLMHHLAVASDVRIGTLAIRADNVRSLAVARRCRFGEPTKLHDGWLFKKPVPPTTYTDGTVTIRRQSVDDIERLMESVDDEQIRWLWQPGQRESWEAMSGDERAAHQRRWIDANRAMFATGPKWCFSVDVDGSYVGYVDCDLANPNTPPGEANISYAAHPDRRGNGYITRAVRLVLAFLGDHTGARQAFILVDERNEASVRVVRALARDHHDSSISISPPSSPISISTDSSTVVGTFTV